MGIAALEKVTVIAPRTDYPDVAKRLAEFKDFHIVESKSRNFDPNLEGLAVRAVRLYAQADQVVKDLSIPLAPGMLDVIFRGVRVPRAEYNVKDLADLLDRAERDLNPIYEVARNERARLNGLTKDESDVEALMNSLKLLSGLSVDLTRFARPGVLKVVLAIVDTDSVSELGQSLADMIFLSREVGSEKSLVLVAGPFADALRIEKSLKALEAKPLSIPESLPQNPAAAYEKLQGELERVQKERLAAGGAMEDLGKKSESTLLAVRELAESANVMLDDVRVAGGLKRLASISGYIPAQRLEDFKRSFGGWIVHAEPVNRFEHRHDGRVPILMTNPGPLRPFETITRQQGTPAEHEVDPTPIIALVFPIFYGMMFGDLGHGLVVAAFAFLIRTRAKDDPGLRQWGNIFLAAGISASIFGAAFGEFFGFPLPFHLLEIVVRPPLVAQTSLNTAATYTLLEIAVLIGIAHITTGLSLNVWEGIKSHDTVELLTEKVPSLIMYLSGVGYGLAFIGAGYSFNVLKTSKPAPLLGIPNSTLGAISLVVVVASMVVLAVGKGVAIKTGRLEGESAGSAFANGAIEVFEKITQFLSNTISYARLAILLFVHAALLIALNLIPQNYPIYVAVVPLVVLNILVILLEGLVVYIQDLRLHVYEFFTKFYAGDGVPFKRIFREKVRIKVNWLQA
ncbi:MAG: hypothetical protein OK422_04110 [Thaumarchaeota archaeon]|nr:hypothetical protein [Nitrososphaerota archaeon]